MAYRSQYKTTERNRMTAELVTPPASEPVTVAQAKKHLAIGTDTTHDEQLAWLIESSRQQWEHDTDSGVISQSWRVQFELIDGLFIELPKSPLASVTAVQYYDLNNTLQTISPTDYYVDTANRRIHLAYGKNWPVTLDRWDGVTVNYVVGYADAAAVPAIVKQAMLLLIGHYFENRDMLLSEAMQSLKPYEMLVRRYMRSSYP